MFAGFARRLTAWYVVAAATLVGLVVCAFALLALSQYVHLTNEGIAADAREATAFSARAVARHQDFVAAAREIETRLRRSGVKMVAEGPFPRPPFAPPRPARRVIVPLVMKPPGRHGPFRGHDHNVIVDGELLSGASRDARPPESRLGFAIGTLFGAHVERVDFVGGVLTVLPDANATQRIALLLLAAVVAVTALAAAGAWFAGRYITSRVLRPLIEVTTALQRFAGRDFTPQSVAVAGKSDFAAIALAYNAAAAQVAAAFAERAAAEQQMRQFVADAGHELRTPLTIVLGYIDLLRRRADEGDERSRRIFASIASEGARMRTLIDNLVLLARMEGDDVRPAEPFGLRSLLEEIVDARRLLAPQLRVDLDVPQGVTIVGNRDELHEAISNLIDNAIKYAPGSPIEIRTVALAGGGIELRVTDRGPGIDVEERGAIFDRFFRGARRGEVEGSGLGLAIAKRAIERAGGQLRLAETSSGGSTFAVRLRADSRADAQPEVSPA